MKKVKVQLVSIAPMLMNKRQMISEEAALAKKKSDVIDPKVDAENKSHHDPKIGYYIASDQIEGCMREAGKNLKKGRGSLKKTILSSVFCDDEKIPLGRKDYDEIDRRFCTLPSTGAGVLINRVRFNSWKAKFVLTFDETRISEKEVKACLEEAGAVTGVGSYRPKFGRFKIESFEVQ